MEMGMTSRTRDNLIYGGIALGSVAFLTWIIPTYTPEYPGYGVSAALLPNVAVSIILVLSLLALAQNFLAYLVLKKKNLLEPEKPTEEPQENGYQAKKVHLVHLARFMIPCLLVMPAMHWLGYVPAGILFLLAIQYIGLRPKPLTGLLVATIPVGVMYVLMVYGLGVPLP